MNAARIPPIQARAAAFAGQLAARGLLDPAEMLPDLVAAACRADPHLTEAAKGLAALQNPATQSTVANGYAEVLWRQSAPPPPSACSWCRNTTSTRVTPCPRAPRSTRSIARWRPPVRPCQT